MPDKHDDELGWKALEDLESAILNDHPHSHQTLAERAMEIAGIDQDPFRLAHAGSAGAGGHLTVAEQALLYSDRLGDALGQDDTADSDPFSDFGPDPTATEESDDTPGF